MRTVHRFSAFPDEEVSAKGKIVKKYRTYLTPCMKLCALPRVEDYLKMGVTVETLIMEAQKKTHLAAAKATEKARNILFNSFSSQK